MMHPINNNIKVSEISSDDGKSVENYFIEDTLFYENQT